MNYPTNDQRRDEPEYGLSCLRLIAKAIYQICSQVFHLHRQQNNYPTTKQKKHVQEPPHKVTYLQTQKASTQLTERKLFSYPYNFHLNRAYPASKRKFTAELMTVPYAMACAPT